MAKRSKPQQLSWRQLAAFAAVLLAVLASYVSSVHRLGGSSYMATATSLWATATLEYVMNNPTSLSSPWIASSSNDTDDNNAVYSQDARNLNNNASNDAAISVLADGEQKQLQQEEEDDIKIDDSNKTELNATKAAEDDNTDENREESKTADQSSTTNRASTTNGPMNILVLYPDDWRHDSLQDARPKDVISPFLSKLASEGIRFTHNAVTTSICWISRATLFSGQYAAQHMSHRLFCPVFTQEQAWKNSWPALLQRHQDYFVGHIGKWQYHNSDKWMDSAFNWTKYYEGHHWYNRDGKKMHGAEMCADDAIQFLRERPRTLTRQGVTTPFALTVAFYPPKPVGSDPKPGSAWQPDDAHKALYKDKHYERPYDILSAFDSLPPFLQNGISRHRYMHRWNSSEQFQVGMQNYHALITHVDDAAARIIGELKAQGVYNNTLIIVTADNGLMMGAHGLAGKWHPWEDSIRVPLIVYDPRMPQEKRGKLDESFTLNIDLAPTILGAAGITAPATMQGRDLGDLYLPTKRNDETWRDSFFYEFPLREFPSSTAVITREWKYVAYVGRGVPGDKYEQLFHLKTDPYELKDRRHDPDVGDVLEQLRALHTQLRQEVTKPLAPNASLPECKRGEAP